MKNTTKILEKIQNFFFKPSRFKDKLENSIIFPSGLITGLFGVQAMFADKCHVPLSVCLTMIIIGILSFAWTMSYGFFKNRY